jgi:hypothetical protein
VSGGAGRERERELISGGFNGTRQSTTCSREEGMTAFIGGWVLLESVYKSSRSMAKAWAQVRRGVVRAFGEWESSAWHRPEDFLA